MILGIETSCDETAAAVVENGKTVRSSAVISQDELHSRTGGVVPERASRAHAEKITRVIDSALAEADITARDLTAVAVTNRPGLIGSLLVGVTAAKAVAFCLDIPLVPVQHVHAHLYANALEGSAMTFPCIGLLVSGGHTSLYHGSSVIEWELLGRTVDDAAGEAFDKVAIMLGLGYPGGRKIEEISRDGDPEAFRFPRSLLEKNSLDFSFSGLKTSLLYHIFGTDARGPEPGAPPPENAPNIAASFQEAVCDTIAEKVRRAVIQKNASTVYAGGGVICNTRLRERIMDACKTVGARVTFPSPSLCTDNAVMTAGMGHHLLENGETAKLDLEVSSR